MAPANALVARLEAVTPEYRVAPNNIDAEQALLGAILVNNDAYYRVLGLHTVPVALHPEVDVKVTINIARSPEEAERQARGETVTVREETNLDDLGLEVGAALADAGDTREC